MKLRIRGNSLRLRLLRGEVEQLGATGRIAETICFGVAPASSLIYALEIDNHAGQIFAVYAADVITIRIPEKTAREWIASDKISLLGEQIIRDAAANDASENILKILIEKDFACPDRENDPDNDDAFPRPSAKCL